jgi:hypothetical protein
MAPACHAPFVAAKRRLTPGKIHRGLIEIGDPALRIGGVDGGRDRGEQILQAPSALFELTLRFPALGDVPRDFRGADDFSGAGAHRGDGQRNINQAAVLASSHRFVVIDALTAHDPGDDIGFFILPVRGKDERDRTADRLLGGVAKQPFRAGVPGLDHAVEVLADDRVIGRFNDCAQLDGAALSLVPRPFRLQTRGAEAQLARDRQGHLDLRPAEPVWPVVIGHELAGQPAVQQDRDEDERADAFAGHDLLQGRR